MGHILSKAATEFQEKQSTTMAKNQEAMRRTMLVQQIAIGRERFYWFATGYGFILAGVTAATMKAGFKPSYMIPVLFGGLFMGYQWDMVFGNKTERINRYTKQILKEKHWFVPINPTDAEVEEIKRR